MALIVWLVYFCVSRIDMIPHKTTGSSSYISPIEGFTWRKVHAKLHLRVGFGDYVEAFDPTADNTLKPRTQAAIALLPLGNAKGSVEFLSLETSKYIRRDQFTPLPMPDTVIAHSVSR